MAVSVGVVRAAAVQMTATTGKEQNLRTATDLVRRAAAHGAELVVLPELWSILGPPEVILREAEPLDGPTLSSVRDLAREVGIWLVAGSIPEQAEEGERCFNTSCLVCPDGEITASYRKIHLFDNEVPGAAYRESSTVTAGSEIVTASVITAAEDEITVGMSTCYDLRFPEMYRVLALGGARVVVVPSAFTSATGAAHWDLLVRARAVENQLFVVAPNQSGMTGAGVSCWGHSVIVDPWGVVLATAPDRPGHVIADLDLARLAEVRASLPSLANRRPETYRWPEAVPA